MNEILRTALGNFSDVFGSVVDNLCAISNTVVQETSLVGFVYVITGLLLIAIGILLVVIVVKVGQNWVNATWKSIVLIWISILSAFFVALGMGVAMANLSSWISPTKEVVREAIKVLGG